MSLSRGHDRLHAAPMDSLNTCYATSESSQRDSQWMRRGDRRAYLLLVVHGYLDEDHGEDGGLLVGDGLPLVDLLGLAAEELRVEADAADEELLRHLHC